MFVGLAELIIAIPGADNLKAKRSVIRKVIERTRSRFSVAVAETGLQDKWQRAQVGIALVGNQHRMVQSTLDKIIHFIEELYMVSILDVYKDVSVFSVTDSQYHGFDGE
ncbi:MAG: DUF503 domain-containing protein [Bradymonadales bacterium]|nr:DUF503 domain-containing protein [Bradymonadales bacterium]